MHDLDDRLADESDLIDIIAEDLDWRVLIKLDLQVGLVHLVDQFEWPFTPDPYAFSACLDSDDSSTPQKNAFSLNPTPESFSRQLCSDLGIGGEFVSMIAHSIREQLCFARLNFEEALKVHGISEPPMRVSEQQQDWQPYLEELDDEELERRAKEQERAAR